MKKKKTPSQAFKKISHYCAYRERSHLEVYNKLQSYDLNEKEIEPILAQLVEEGYLDTQRYANALARGKFSINKWGKIKIIAKLKQQQLSSEQIKKAIDQIEYEDYIDTLSQLIKKKWHETQHKIDCQQRVARYAMCKGYEAELVYSLLDRMKPS